MIMIDLFQYITLKNFLVSAIVGIDISKGEIYEFF